MTTPNFKNSQLGITVSTDHPSFLVGSSGILFTDGSRQLTAFTGTALTNETDPIFTGSVSYNITSVQTGQWSQAYSWGDHSTLYATTGELSSVSGYLQSKIDAIPSDTNTFASSVTYNTGDRNLILNRNDGVSLTGNFDVVLHSGDNVSILVNDANYLVSGTNYHPNISAAISSDNNNNTFIQDILLDSNGHVTGITTAVATGTGGGGGQLTTEQVQDIVGNMVSSNVESGIAVTYNDAGDGTGKLNFIVASQTDENFTTADHSKLDGIEANADVTDSGNVTSAGALMDSEVTNLGQVKTFDSSDYATAAQGTKADSAQQPPSEGAFANGDKTKLDDIETLADVTDAANVTSAGAVMNSGTSTANMSFVVDEDNMASDSATKVPTQQSVKYYIDNAGYLTGNSSIADLSDVATNTPIGQNQVLAYASSGFINTNLSLALIEKGTEPIGGYSTTQMGHYFYFDASSEAVINTDGDDINFRVEGSGGTNLLFTDAGTDRVGIGNNLPTHKLDVTYADGHCVRFADSGGSGVMLGDCALDANDRYTGIKHTDMVGNTDYMMVSDGDDTYISAKDGQSVFIRGGGNAAEAEIRIHDVGAGGVGIVFNEAGADRDIRMESTGNANLFRLDASTDRIGIGTATPASTLDVNGTLTATTLIKSGGTSSQFLKADGSVDTSTYLTSVAFSNIAAEAIVTEGEGISSNDNDTTIPTSAAVKDYTDNNAGKTYTAGSGIVLSGGDSTVINVSDSTLLNTEIQAGSGINLVYDSGNGTLTINRTSENIGNLVTTETVGGRLTLESGVSVSATNQTAKTILYFTPHVSNNIALYNGSEWNGHNFNQLELSLSGYTADKNFDIFVHATGGVPVLESLVWTNDSTRATALTTQDGVYVKSGATTRRYLGTIRTTNTTGQCEDSIERRFVWSYYNQVKKDQFTSSVATTHTYASSVWRATNNDTTVGVKRYLLVLGLDTFVTVSVNNHSKFMYTSAALDGTTASEMLNGLSGHNGDITYNGQTFSLHKQYVSAGYHFIQELEYGVNSSSVGYNSEIAGDHLC